MAPQGNTLIGDEQVNQVNHDPLPLDFANVKNPWRHKSDRQTLSDSITNKVDLALLEQKEKEKNSRPSNQPEREEKNITDRDRNDKILDMFERAGNILGIAPITKASISKAMTNMTRRGVLHPGENQEQKCQRTVKSMIKSWACQNLKMTDDDWAKINIKEIMPTARYDSDIIFIRYATHEDVAKVNSKARNLLKSSQWESPCLVMYVDS